MSNRLMDLDYLVNLEKFQIIQDDIAKATDMAVIAVNYKGQPITRHSRCTSFCSNIRKDPELRKLCEKCDSRGGLEAVRNQEEYIYLCHVGAVDIALPIIVDGQYLGALMAGQIRLENQDNHQKLERIVSRKYQIDFNEHPELKALYEEMPVMSLDKIEAVAHMMQHLINYIVSEAVLKLSLYDINEKLTAYSKDHPEFDDEVNDIQLYYPMSNNSMPASPPTNPDQAKVSSEASPIRPLARIDAELIESNPILAHKRVLLKPALDYINEHYDQKIYMDKMAYLCNISASYFSKIFKRETGYNFSTYVNNVKTRKAVELLETTTAPIINISLDLGYDDCGYFIKVFKKNFGVTPASYRKSYKDQQ